MRGSRPVEASLRCKTLSLIRLNATVVTVAALSSQAISLHPVDQLAKAGPLKRTGDDEAARDFPLAAEGTQLVLSQSGPPAVSPCTHKDGTTRLPPTVGQRL